MNWLLEAAADTGSDKEILKILVVCVTGIAVTAVSALVWILKKGKGNNDDGKKPEAGKQPGQTKIIDHDRWERLDKRLDEFNGHLVGLKTKYGVFTGFWDVIRKLEQKIDELHKWHDQDDPNQPGSKIWYNNPAERKADIVRTEEVQRTLEELSGELRQLNRHLDNLK